MLARLARPGLEQRQHRLHGAAESSGGGLLPQECDKDLPNRAAMQLGGQQGSDH